MVYIAGLSLVRPGTMPPLPPEARTERGRALAIKVAKGMVPSIALIFLVLGTIALGLASPTEAGAMGAVGAMALAAINRRLTWPLVREAMAATMRITSMVVFILVGSTVFTLVFRGMDGGLWIEYLLSSLPGGQVGFLVFVNAFVFVLAFFLDFFEIAFIVIPLLAPVADKLGIDLVWFGVLLCINMQTSFMHPPFGFALFYLRGIAAPRREELRHLSRRHTLGADAAHPGGDRHPLAAVGDLLALGREEGQPRRRQDRDRPARLHTGSGSEVLGSGQVRALSGLFRGEGRAASSGGASAGDGLAGAFRPECRPCGSG